MLTVEEKPFKRLTKRLLAPTSPIQSFYSRLPTPPADDEEANDDIAASEAAQQKAAEDLQRFREDVILDFADGRRLRANQIGDGGTDVRNDVMELLILKTDLAPEHALTEEDVPPLSSSR